MTRKLEQDRRSFLQFLANEREMWRSIHTGTLLPEDQKKVDRYDHMIAFLNHEKIREALK